PHAFLLYLKKMAGNPLNKLILVGYQAQGTLGRALQEGAKKVKLDGSDLNIQMSVELYHMSAHADRRQLESIPGKISGLSNIFIVHGEKSKSESLKKYFESKYNTVVPRLGEKFTI
ncbi:MAG: MBL fold metallo-hydrolase, partial [Candidatus Marsarchaeota archaeon]|nr:MBL fold metallo-hydrolase [Candidatus Marsarchaeota archaeon]